MSRRPAATARRGTAMGHGQQAIWEVICDKRSCTITEIWELVDMHRKSIINYVKRLEAGGYVRKADDFETSYVYELVRDGGRHAPRLTRDGKPVTQGKGNQNMWRSMRMMGQFSPTDLAAHSTTDSTDVSLTTAKAYCTELTRAGYLRVIRKARPPKAQAVYKLVRDTGPLPPQITKVTQVFDQNLQCLMPQGGGS